MKNNMNINQIKDVLTTDDYWSGLIYHIINKRYNDMKDSVMTSNKSREEFEKTTISPVKSRIDETGGVLSFDSWKDWRSR